MRVLLPGTAVKSYLVPAVAVSTYGQMERLFVIRDGTAELRLVRTGERQGEQVEILAGVSAGEQVVVQGQDLLRDGQPVQLMP